MPGLMAWCTSRSCNPKNNGRSNSTTTSIQINSPLCSLKIRALGAPWARSMMRLRKLNMATSINEAISPTTSKARKLGHTWRR